MLDAELKALLGGKDDSERAEIARRAGAAMSVERSGEAERRAAEALARALLNDAIVSVRSALSQAVRDATHLPRDFALKIAHDVDAVAAPFLEATEIFSDSDWQQLVLTLSRGAMIAAARRSAMSEALALTLAEQGDVLVAETLVGNGAAPMTGPVCHTLMDRFVSENWVLDKLAERDDLLADIAVELVAKVSAAAREKLARTYRMPHHTAPLVDEAEHAAMLRVIRETAEGRLPELVDTLRKKHRLTSALMLAAARDGQLSFLGAVLATLSRQKYGHCLRILRQGGAGSVVRLFTQARVPSATFDEIWDALRLARERA